MILVIEDNFQSRELLCDYLEVCGFSVVSADDGKAGLEVANQQLPDLIISDIDMPWMNGFQVLEHLRHNPQTAHIPFVVYTAASERHRKTLATHLGANAYLTKPSDLSAIMQVINQQLQSRAAL
ncbi:MAG TPA: response regulator [Leptolyngbya sp.]|jgi:CheY-like chemotaxis protein|nr:response regulator [Leptolyngbya sp.]